MSRIEPYKKKAPPASIVYYYYCRVCQLRRTSNCYLTIKGLVLCDWCDSSTVDSCIIRLRRSDSYMRYAGRVTPDTEEEKAASSDLDEH